MKHILSTIIISSLIAVTASSCTGKFEEINSNPYQPGVCRKMTMHWGQP